MSLHTIKYSFIKSSYLKILLGLCFTICLSSCKEMPKYKTPNDSIFVTDNMIPDGHFLGDEACKSCHQAEFNSWKGSHHDKAMMFADSTSVLADFKGETYTSQGLTSYFYQKDGDYYVNTEGPDGKYQDYKIVYTFGVTPLQQYIVKFPNGHYQCLRTAWDSIKKEWFDLYPDFKVVHSEWLHWTKGGLNWNNMCADCHSTNVRKNYHSNTDSYDTQYAIINVNCESCHGPGKQHVEDAIRLGDSYTDSKTLKMTITTPPKQLVDDCARCHVRREQFSEFYNFEGSLLDHYFPEIIREPLYHPDGQILDEVYVYGSFIQSKMYQNNVACNHCHDSHSLKLKFDDNLLCAQCHEPKTYDNPTHHFHKMNTEASKCINCHMTGKYYMGVDFRRDHSFRIPRPDLSLKFNTPNACTGCHDEKDDEWAWAEFKKQYGVPDYIHFSEKLAPGITLQPNADVGLIELMNDTLQPAIARASAARALSNYNSQNHIEAFLKLLNDESPLVRGVTIDVLGEINTPDYLNYFLPLLEDGKRSVRIKAFFALAAMDETQIPEHLKAPYKKVEKEFFIHIKSNLDFTGTNIKLANYNLKKGNIQKAIEGYEKALKIDNLNNQVRLNLANLYYTNAEFDKAEIAFNTVIEQEPKFGPAYYSLALLFAELNQTEKALVNMQMAYELMPDNIRVYYNLSLLYNKLNSPIQAENILIKGLELESTNESLLYTLAYLYANNNKKEEAKNIVVKLIELYPENNQYKAFYQQL